MTHKVHPKALRMRRMEDFNVRGFYGSKMPKYLQEDFIVKDFLMEKLSEALIANIEIDHSDNKMQITIDTARPGLIIGRGGEGVESLKKQVEKIILKVEQKALPAAGKAKLAGKSGLSVKIEIREIKNPWISAPLVAKMAAQQIERRMPFRQVLKRSIERVMQNKEVKGIRMEVSGRLNGVEIARKEWLRQGRMPRQTIRADIEYALTQAYCTYGTIGIKVWIYKGDKFE